MMNKKGQGLSLTTIIIAAIALIVLVVLVMIFTGRIGIFKTGVEEAGEAELIKLRISYGDCHPSTGAEATFSTSIGQAATEEDKEVARSVLKGEIDRCKALIDKDSCEGAGCSWK
jgi:uncharacterized membrane protein YqiK